MHPKYKSLIGNKHASGNSPNKTSFKSGNIPWNKDEKGIHLSPKSEFKKGYTPQNKLSVGSITIRIDRSGKKRKWIKIDEPKYWIPLAQHIWITNRGYIPNGFILHHIDENTLNDEMNNLSLITRGAHINIHREQLNNARYKVASIAREQSGTVSKETMCE